VDLKVKTRKELKSIHESRLSMFLIDKVRVEGFTLKVTVKKEGKN